MNQGDVSSSIWSLSIEADDGLTSADSLDDNDGGGGVGTGVGVASEFLVLAELDSEEDEPSLAAVGWTASGVVVLVFVGVVVVWM